MNNFKKLSRTEMKNVRGGDIGPGDCPASCTPSSCYGNAPYCRATTCVDKNGVSHNIDACSPTQE